MLKYLIGAAAGGLIGYFILYRLIGCSDGTCALTANPYVSTIIGIVMGVLIAGSFATSNKSGDTSQQDGYKRITAVEAKARIDSKDEVIILDVRTQGEYDNEHIPNAILIPNETIGAERSQMLPDLNAEILVYCRSGNRSAQAARKLIKMGYTNVYDFGGIGSWPYETVRG